MVSDNSVGSMKDFLFRYRAFKPYNIQALAEGKLFFSTPSEFNDPFDSVVYVDQQKLYGSIEYALRANLDSYLDIKHINPKGKALKKVLALSDKSVFDLPQSSELIQGFMEHVHNTSNKFKQQINANSKVVCFSEDYLSPLMWAHYADNHKGFALGYAKSNLLTAPIYNEIGEKIGNKMILDRVNYAKTTPDSGQLFYDIFPEIMKEKAIHDTSKFYKQVLYNKTSEWCYEKEWRLCSVQDTLETNNPARYMLVEPCMMFLGAKMPSQNRETMVKIAREKEMPVFEVWANDKEAEFKLNFCLIYPKQYD